MTLLKGPRIIDINFGFARTLWEIDARVHKTFSKNTPHEFPPEMVPGGARKYHWPASIAAAFVDYGVYSIED